MGLLDVFGTGDQQAAANAQISGINSGIGQANNYFNQGQNALQTNYTAGLQPFLQNYSQSQQGTTALGNALGLNGQQGSAAALQAFQGANPGYQFQLQQGQNAVLANQAATGQLASGATNLDLTNYSQGLANQTYNQYVQNLMPYLGASQSAASGIGTLDSGLGNQMNAALTNQGQANYGAATSIGNANANADLAGLGASANLLGAGAGLLGLGTGGGATIGGSLFNSFPSDARVKDDIEHVGELYDGQPIYRYRYKGDTRPQIGLIAQNVAQTDPDAVSDMGGGIMGVDYGKATSRAAQLARFMQSGIDAGGASGAGDAWGSPAAHQPTRLTVHPRSAYGDDGEAGIPDFSRDATGADEAATAAARRTRESVRPTFGRSQGDLTRIPEAVAGTMYARAAKGAAGVPRFINDFMERAPGSDFTPDEVRGGAGAAMWPLVAGSAWDRQADAGSPGYAAPLARFVEAGEPDTPEPERPAGAAGLQRFLRDDDLAIYGAAARGAPGREAAGTVARAIAPNMMDYFLTPAPTPRAPRPGFVGKIPEQDPMDPRLVPALTEAAGLGSMMIPGGLASRGLGAAAEMTPAIGRRAAVAGAARRAVTDPNAADNSVMQSIFGLMGGDGVSPAEAKTKKLTPEQIKIQAQEMQRQQQLKADAEETTLLRGQIGPQVKGQGVDVSNMGLDQLRDMKNRLMTQSQRDAETNQLRESLAPQFPGLDLSHHTLDQLQGMAKAKAAEAQSNAEYLAQRARDKAEGERPFREVHRDIAHALPWIGGAMSAAIPYGQRAMNTVGAALERRQWTKTGQAFRDAMDAGDWSGMRLNANRLAAHEKSWPEMEAGMDKGLGLGGRLAAGFLPAEGALFPLEYDQATQPKGSKSKPGIQDYVNAAPGVGLSWLGGFGAAGAGSKFPMPRVTKPGGLAGDIRTFSEMEAGRGGEEAHRAALAAVRTEADRHAAEAAEARDALAEMNAKRAATRQKAQETRKANKKAAASPPSATPSAAQLLPRENALSRSRTKPRTGAPGGSFDPGTLNNPP